MLLAHDFPASRPLKPMSISNLEELFIEQLKDLYNSEEQIQEAYTRWRERAETTELRDMFNEHINHSNTRKKNIDAICGKLDVSPTGEKCEGTEGLIKEGDDLLGELEGGAIQDAGLIAMSQRIEHYGIAGYGCARTYAQQLGHSEAADQLQQSLDQAVELDQKMSKLAEKVLNPEAAKA